MISFFKTVFDKVWIGIKNPMLILKGLRQIFIYVYRIVKYRSLSVNINTKEFWNNKLSKFETTWRDEHYHHIIDLFPQNKAFTLLDIGCALGDGTELILEKFPKAKVTGIDLSEIGIEKAKRKTRGVSYLVLDVLKDEIPGTYDYITVIETLEHFDDPFSVVDKCLKHCNKAIIISTPYTAGYQGKINFVDEHRYAFNEKTFENYNAKVVKVTDFIEATKSQCIVYEIQPS